MKKNEEIKNAFKASFLQKSPKDFAPDVMQKIEASQQVKALLPAYVLWILIISFLALFTFLVLSVDTSSVSFSPYAFVEFWQNNLSLFVLPFCVLTLMFLQSVWFKKGLI